MAARIVGFLISGKTPKTKEAFLMTVHHFSNTFEGVNSQALGRGQVLQLGLF
jgi:hypothetical protein